MTAYLKRKYLVFIFLSNLFAPALLYKSAYSQSLVQPKFVALNGSRNFDDIRELLLDSKGFLWFGCNQGLVRFDGTKYTRFVPDTTAQTIASDRITALCEDAAGQVWIGTEDKGLYSYSYSTDKFSLQIKANQNSVPLIIYGVQVYNQGLLVTSNRGVSVFTPAQKAILPLAFTDSLQKNNAGIIKCVVDPRKNDWVWMLGAGGLFSCQLNTGLYKKWHSYPHSADEINNQLKTLSVTAEGVVYSATKNLGLVQLVPVTGAVSLFTFTHKAGKSYSSNNIDAIQPVDIRSILVATRDSGIGIFDNELQTFHFLDQGNFPESDFYQLQATAFTSHNGTIVFATQHKGIWVYNGTVSARFKTVAVSSVNNKVPGTLYVRSLLPMPERNTVLAGSYFGDGLYVYNTVSAKMETYPFPKNAAASKTLIINHIYKDSKGIIWLSSQENGLLIFDSSKKQIIPAAALYPSLVQFPSQKIYCVYEDGRGELYVATGDKGLAVISPERTAFQVYQHSGTDSTSILSNEIFAEKLYEDKRGRIWVSVKNGLSVFQPSEKKFYHFISGTGKYNSIPPAFWYAVSEDAQGDIVIGTNEGLCQVKPDAKSLASAKRFTDKDGLLHNNVYSMVKDREGLLWITCRTGISCFDPIRASFRNFTYSNGLPAKTLMSPMQLAGDGNIYHGAVEQFFFFNPRDLQDKKMQQLPWLTAFKIFDKDSVNGLALNNLSQLQLDHTQGSFSFSFTVPSLFYSASTQYAYMLEGVDDDWKSGGNRNYAAYTNIKPGTYVFKVKASDADGTWSEHARSITVIIAPPFWQRWWFVLLLAMLISAAVYGYIKKREKIVAHREAEKTEIEKLKASNYQYQLEIEKVTNYFSSAINEQKTVDGLLWEIARNCISTLGFEDCVIYLIDKEKNVLVQKAAWGPKSDTDNKILSPIEIKIGEGIVGTVAKTGLPEIVNDVSADARYIVDDASRKAEISVPIMYNHEVLGVLDSESSSKDFYSALHLQVLSSIASHCAEKIMKLKTDEELSRNEKALLQSQRRLSEEKLIAIRSQMNPHFIFNSLNSIQQFILVGDIDNANKYLSKFSRLIRLVLQSSESNFISLEEEIGMLQIYLELEKSRFGNSFDYIIYKDENLDEEEIKIPNLMIQPFVENAIWHGLMHKEGDRKLSIKFLLKSEDHIVCEIEDNGIGREKAAAIKKTKIVDIKHTSRGMQLIKDKIEILQQQFKGEVSVNIYDIKSLDATVLGTRVVIVLPLNFQVGLAADNEE